MPKNKSINLLPQEEFNTSTVGRILKWATGTFRIIVIVTETVVMAAFLSRFWLDTQNSNLNKTIKTKAAQITAQADFEKEFRNIQTKLTIFDKINKSQQTTEIINKITSGVPSSITLTRIFIDNGAAEVRGTSLSDFDINVYLNNLENGSFKAVDLKQISSTEGGQGGTNFVIGIIF